MRPLPREKQTPEVINGRLYARADLVQRYLKINLSPAEATALIRYAHDFERRRVLDIGCGAGRLAIYLHPLTERYVGIDVSPHMLAYCRAALPTMHFLEGNMVALDSFGDACFDAVLAVANVLDAVSHANRLCALAGVRRVLAPGGLLVFSSHNRNVASAQSRPSLQRSRNPFTQLRNLADYATSVLNHRRIRLLQRFEADYALLNDEAHEYSVLHYYIDRQSQRRQLEANGFELLECLGGLGETLAPGDDDSAFPSILYIARRT